MTSVGRRLLLLVPVVLGVVTLTFLLMHITPGDPAIAYLGVKAGPEALDALRRSWGLDQPLWRQYLGFMGGVLRGDFGVSMYFKAPVTELIATRLPVTLLLMSLSTVFIVVIGVPLAVLAAVRRDGWADAAIQLGASVGLGMPQFWVGTMLVLFLSLKAGLFPVAGYGTGPGQHLLSLVLPSLTVAVATVPLIMRSLRASMIEALDSEFVAFGRAKGLRPRTVLVQYGLRNGCISAVTILGINIGGMVGGTLVVENVFGLPGLGQLMMQGILNRDFPVVQGTTLVFAAVVVLVYLATDVSYRFLDPRVRA